MKKILIVTILIVTSSTWAFVDDSAMTAVPQPSIILILGWVIVSLGLFFLWKSKKNK